MKYEILGFNQEKVLELELSVNDLILLNYITDAIASPTMQHRLQDGIAYVWLKHDRILQDLPILDIKERSLINYLNKLKDLGLLNVIVIKVDCNRGSKSYYSITEKCEALKYDQVQNFAVNQRPSAKNCTSDISSSSHISINNTNKQNILIEDNEDANYNIEKKSNKVDKFISDYNSICKSLPKCVRVTDKRKKAILKILNIYSEEEILQVFTNLESSDFCKGKNDRGWKADIDFILREDKFVATLEGKYNSKSYGCNVETISNRGAKRNIVTKEEKEEMRRLVELGELEEY